MERLLAVLGLVLFVVTVGIALGRVMAGQADPVYYFGSGQAQAEAAYQAEAVLQEDDPGWDCRVMGNRRCGPVEPPAANRLTSEPQRSVSILPDNFPSMCGGIVEVNCNG